MKLKLWQIQIIQRVWGQLAKTVRQYHSIPVD